MVYAQHGIRLVKCDTQTPLRFGDTHDHLISARQQQKRFNLQNYGLCCRGTPHGKGVFCGGVMVKTIECGIVVREFELQSCYYVHFRRNSIGKGMNPLILPAMG